jgi:hypothetical protein
LECCDVPSVPSVPKFLLRPSRPPTHNEAYYAAGVHEDQQGGLSPQQ